MAAGPTIAGDRLPAHASPCSSCERQTSPSRSIACSGCRVRRSELAAAKSAERSRRERPRRDRAD